MVNYNAFVRTKPSKSRQSIGFLITNLDLRDQGWWFMSALTFTRPHSTYIYCLKSPLHSS